MTRKTALLTLTLAGALGTTHCSASASMGPRLIVLGVDGMDFKLTRELMAAGRLPNFSRLAASGGFSSLATSIPPQSPVAWSSVITGLPPGGHGIFDFVHRDPRTLEPYLSTSRSEPARHVLTFGSWRVPLSSARMVPLRGGEPFWKALEEHGVRTTIVRMPANFPPSGSASLELSGMGTPDLLGTYGMFSFFTSRPPAKTTTDGGRVVPVDVVDDVVHGSLQGPDNPFRATGTAVAAPFTVYLDATHAAIKLVIGDSERILRVGEWSQWTPVRFSLAPFYGLSGMCRFYLKQVAPFELYASPVNIDPFDPAMPISTPASFAASLAEATGRFYTQGIAEETKALSAHLLTRDEFLQQATLVRDEHTRQYWSVIDGFKSGLLFYYFSDLDQISHMLWRARDPGHPAYEAARDAPYRGVIEDWYVAVDRLVGETVRRVGTEVPVIVMSDHGFTSWRRTFHLNTWLRDHGYLTPIDPAQRSGSGGLQDIDWARTRAYALGLNALYLNLAGRERSGAVSDADARSLLAEIRRDLLATVDPMTGKPAVSRVFGRDDIRAAGGAAPDLIIGYAEGTRVSNESALGAFTRDEFSDNIGEWSGDHCMDPATVPGILLSSRPLRRRPSSLEEIAGAVLAEFGLEQFSIR